MAKFLKIPSMDKLFILKLAVRNLALHRMRAVLTLLGMVIGISSIVFLVSFAFGIERLVTREVTGGDAFRLIDVGTGNSQIITLSDETISGIRTINKVTGVFGLALVGATTHTNSHSSDVALYGADREYLQLSGVNVYKGAWMSNPENEVIVNDAYADFWSAANNGADILGKEAGFDVVIPKALSGKGEDVPVTGQTFKIVGVVKNSDTPKVYAPLDTLRRLGVTGYSQLTVEVAGQGEVASIRKQLENMGLKTQYVGDTIDQIDQIFSVFRTVLGAFGAITLIVAILGMFNILTISLMERIKEVALMKMMGMRKRDINNVFLAESVLLGLLGGFVGVVIGVILGQIANRALDQYAIKMGGQPVSIFYTPFTFVVVILAGSLLIGLVTGWYPARRAVRVKALDVLRYE